MTEDPKDQSSTPEHKPRMAVPPDSPPGMEQDEQGNVIPFEKRTRDDQERARNGR